MKKTIMLLIVLTILFCISHKAYAKTNFVIIKLQHGISIDIPRNWKVATNDQMITLDTVVESRLDLSNSPKVNSDLGFVAGYFDDAGDKAKVNMRYYPGMKVTQDTVKRATPEDIRKFDNAFKQSDKADPDPALSWGGTRKQEFAGRTALITEYRRAPFSGEQGSFNVRLIRIMDGPKSFTLTVSYNELFASIFKPICDRIILSLKISN